MGITAIGGRAAKVYIILVNWNGWKNTVECLESVFHLGYKNYRVVVCDNGSQDESLQKIKEWAQGHLNATAANQKLEKFVMPAVKKPIAFWEYERMEAEAGGNPDENHPLVLVQIGKNIGFAAANNIGLRYALSRKDLSYAWLLNNDTVVTPQALGALVERMETSARGGLCGSTLLYYAAPEKIQALGGVQHSRWKCRSTNIGLGENFPSKIEPREVEKKMSYIMGASMLVSRRFLDDVGLMEEDYFLYFEEFDWAQRAKHRYELIYAPQSVVYHKGGETTRLHKQEKLSETSLFYLQKNRIVFYRRFRPSFLWFLSVHMLMDVLKAFMRGDFLRGKTIAKALRSGLIER